jgi:DNA-binding protein HU-beta
LAHSSRTWRGARTPQALKRVRQDERKRSHNQPHRSKAKTLVAKAVTVSAGGDAEETRAAVVAAISALDKAAKAGAIHPNAADRRKSRLMRKANAALGGEAVVTSGKVVRSTGKAAAAKEAKARIAASKASKAKGEQTAAGKARAALTKSSRTETAAKAEPTTEVATTAAAKAPAKKPATKTTAAKKVPAAKASSTRTTSKAAATATAAEKPAAKATSRKPAAKQA